MIMETIVYAVIHEYRDMESHNDLVSIHETEIEALKKALELTNINIGKHKVVKWNATKGEIIE